MSPHPSARPGRTRFGWIDIGGSRASGRDGFTLIEVLVAFTVMAVLLSVLFRGVVTMRAGSSVFDARTHEAMVARAVLDDALADRTLKPGRYSGTRDGRRWTLVAKPIDISAQIPSGVPDDSGSNPPSGRGAIPFPALQSAPLPTQQDIAARRAKRNWLPQRLVLTLETAGRPLEIETIRLVDPGS